MRHPLVVTAVLAVVTAGGVSAEVVVHGTRDHLSVRATRAPLSDVLDRLARHTGMKVVYGKVVPRTLVTLNIAGQTEEAVLERLLGGLRLNYVVGKDAARQRVQTVILVDRGGIAAAPVVPPAAAELPASAPPFLETSTSGKEPAAPDDASGAADATTLDMGIPWVSESQEAAAVTPPPAPSAAAADDPGTASGVHRAGAGPSAE